MVMRLRNRKGKVKTPTHLGVWKVEKTLPPADSAVRARKTSAGDPGITGNRVGYVLDEEQSHRQNSISLVRPGTYWLFHVASAHIWPVRTQR